MSVAHRNLDIHCLLTRGLSRSQGHIVIQKLAPNSEKHIQSEPTGIKSSIYFANHVAYCPSVRPI